MRSWLDRAFELFLLMVATLSQVAIIADSFSCATSPSLYLWLLVVCILFWVAAAFRKGLFVSMSLLGITLYAAFRHYRSDPIAELYDLIDKVCGAFYEHVSHAGASYQYENAVPSHALVLLFIGTILAAFLVVSVHGKTNWSLFSIMATLPLFAVCIIVNGDPPALACAGHLLFWALVAIKDSGAQEDGAIGRTMLVCIGPICLVLGILLLIFPPSTYEYTERDVALSEFFDRTGHVLEFFTGGRSGEHASLASPDGSDEAQAPRSSFRSSWDQDDDSMALSQAYDQVNAELTVMQVKAETSGAFYLRIRSFGDYTGTGWRPAEELDAGSSLPFVAFAVEGLPDTTIREVEIRTYADMGALCLPYYSAVSSGQDPYVADVEQANYRVSYAEYRGDLSQLRVPPGAEAAERTYRSHAYKVYTALPEKTLAWAKRYCEVAGLSADQDDIVLHVAAHVRSHGVYDLTTAPYKTDDYALTFLTESQHGYCIHFATAATVLYRALGIPARVTEGFFADVQAGRSTDIKAGSAHSWVEIYQDGLGWIPVEVTASAGIATQDPVATPTSSPTPTPPPSPAATMDPVTDAPEPSAVPTSQPTISQEGTDGPDGTTGTGGADESQTPSAAPDVPGLSQGSEPVAHRSFPWRVILTVFAIILLLPAWYGFARLRFLSQINDRDGRRAAIACWRYAKLAERFGAEMPEPVIRIAEKAAFSSHLILQSEAAECRGALLPAIEARYGQLSTAQKLRYRFLYGLR